MSIEQLTYSTGNSDFINSGVVPRMQPPAGRLKLDVTYFDLSTFLGAPTKRGYMASLTMPPDTRDVAPHFHPGGEIARVLEGSYFDADMGGVPIIGNNGLPLVYTKGMVVVSTQWSNHMPWSNEGAVLEYFTPGGLVSMNRDGMIPEGMSLQTVAEKTIEAAAKAQAPPDALRYAIGWMINPGQPREDMLRKYHLSSGD